MSPLALVRQPEPIQDVDAWTLETIDHRSRVVLAECSPSGDLVATSGLDGTLRIWDTASRQLQKLIVCPGVIWSVAWSPDEKMIAATVRGESNGHSATVWNVEGDPQVVRRFRAPAWYVHWTEPGRVGLILYAADPEKGNVCQYWDVDSGQIVGEIDAGRRSYRRSWSPDGGTVAMFTSGDDGLELRDSRTGESRRLSDAKYLHVAWSPTGEYLAALKIGVHSDEGENLHFYRMQIWNAATGDVVREVTVAKLKLNRTVQGILCWSPDEQQIATHIGSRVELWNAKTGEGVGDGPLVETREPDDQWPQFLAWAASGKALLYGDEGVARLWDFSEETSFRLAGQPGRVALEPGCLSVAGQSLTMRTAHDYFEGQRAVWNLKTLRYVTREEEIAARQAISPDGKLLARLVHVDKDADGQRMLELRVLELPDLTPLPATRFSASVPPFIVWSPDSSKICLPFSQPVSQKGDLRVLDAREGNLLWRQGEQEESPRMRMGPRSRVVGAPPLPLTVAWSPDSRLLAWWQEGSKVVVSQAETGESEYVLATQPQSGRSGPPRIRAVAHAVSWSPNGERLAYLTDENRLAIWKISLEPPELLANGPLPSSGGSQFMRFLKFSPDGKHVSLHNYPDTIQVWDATNGDRKSSWDIEGRIQWHDWTQDSQRIAYRDNDGLAIWNPSMQSTHRLARPSARGYDDCAASEGLIASSTGGTIEMLDDNLELKLSIVPDLESVQQALFVTPRGQYEISPGMPAPRVIVLNKDVQRMMTVEEFAAQYGWKNDVEAAAGWAQ